jgi:hypothetical protein
VKSEKCRIFRFADVWQKRAEFAKHWQIHPPLAFRVLPNIGKNQPKLPNIGKTPWWGEPSPASRLPNIGKFT